MTCRHAGTWARSRCRTNSNVNAADVLTHETRCDMRKLNLTFTALVFVVAGILGASAQGYPTRPISVVVPFPPGGQVDTVARLLLDGMRASLGQPLIVENVGGASGTIGTGRAVRAMPDGYTVVMGNWTSHVGG